MAIGEVGLDKVTSTPFDLQMNILQKQLELAKKYDKPVIIHCVKAYSDLIKIKKRDFKMQVWIFHGFNTSWQVAEQLLQMHCYFWVFLCLYCY